MKDICELEFHIHQIIADSTGAVGTRTSRKNWVLRAGASSLYVTPCACLIIEKPKATNSFALHIRELKFEKLKLVEVKFHALPQ